MNRTLHANLPGPESISPPKSFQGGTLQRKCACGGVAGADGQCEQCRMKSLQRKASAAAPGENHSAVPASVHEVLRSAGEPLDQSTRAFFEPRFGRDFSSVRVHTDSRAAESMRSVNALAYTVGDHIAMPEADFRSMASESRSLLAHELAHVSQQSEGAHAAFPGMIDPSPALESEAEMTAEKVISGATVAGRSNGPVALQRRPAPHIREIRVNQTVPQRVTATWTDGHTSTGECSTGKGHCCFDNSAGTAEGGACSEARSKQVGNNCTPVGTNFTVTKKIPTTAAGIDFWTQFHDAKSVALHDYDPLVDGKPRSHGCVRLHRPFAEIIFNGSVENVTKVIVENLARPDCTHPALIWEWEQDFKEAGKTPPDGTQINPQTGRRFTRDEIARARHSIQETREDLQSAFGVDDAGLNTALASSQSVASRIPRCLPALTVEESSLPAAETAGISTANTTASRTFNAALNRARDQAAAERIVRQQGTDLWQAATAAARAGGAGTDDRQIYWTRLAFSRAIRQWNPVWVRNADQLRRLQSRLLQVLEETSRGRTDVNFPATPGTKRILISGFDPFGFTNAGDIRQGNPSGASVLALDGATLSSGSVTAHVEGVIFPVRFADFDAGVVETFFRPFLAGPQPVDLIITISQGGGVFELEEWAGRRRSAGSYTDNLGVQGGGTAQAPVVPPGMGAGAEFIRTNVPAPMLSSMRRTLGRTAAIPDETQVKSLIDPTSHQRIAVEGSGGGYLSNEIFYRNSRLRTELNSSVPVIHLHTPILQPGAADSVRNGLISKVRDILTATLPHL
jgi:pyrrolidone-carboxylate peptidase